MLAQWCSGWACSPQGSEAIAPDITLGYNQCVASEHECLEGKRLFSTILNSMSHIIYNIQIWSSSVLVLKDSTPKCYTILWSAEWHGIKPTNPTAHVSKTELCESNFTGRGRCVPAQLKVFKGKMCNFQSLWTSSVSAKSILIATHQLHTKHTRHNKGWHPAHGQSAGLVL